VGVSKRVWLETYGCQMNKAESESLLLDLASDGWSEARSEAEADLVVLNTCSVRKTAEERVWGRLAFYRGAKRSRPFTLVLTGCMAERLKGTLSAEHPEVDVVLGTFQKKHLLAAVREAGGGGGPVLRAGEAEYDFAPMHSTGGARAFVPIMHGCDNFCSYCVVPYVRGREVSRSPEEVLAEVRALEARGAREITLLGQNVNSYRHVGPDGTASFDGLLRMVAAVAGGIRWIRFLTSHPRDLSDAIVETMASDARFCRHIHLPMQSGSDAVLARMNRGYAADGYLRLVERIRESLSGAAITTDILIGFPGETEGDFRDTLSLMETVGFDDAFMYYYNPREGTPAFDMEDALPDEVKLERLAAVIETQRRISRLAAAKRLGQRAAVLVEGVSKKDPGELLARTEWDAMAVFPGAPSIIGSFADVTLRSLSGNTYRASLA